MRLDCLVSLDVNLPSTMRSRRHRLSLVVVGGGGAPSLLDHFLVVFLVELDKPHVRVVHVVVAPLPPPDPLSRIGIGSTGSRSGTT